MREGPLAELFRATEAAKRGQGEPETPEPAQPSAGTDTGELWRVSPEARWTLVAKGLPMVQSILPLG